MRRSECGRAPRRFRRNPGLPKRGCGNRERFYLKRGSAGTERRGGKGPMTLLAYVRRLTFSATATWSEKELEEISSEMGVMGAWVRKERRENRRKRARGIGKPKTPSHLHPLPSWCTEALRWSVPAGRAQVRELTKRSQPRRSRQAIALLPWVSWNAGAARSSFISFPSTRRCMPRKIS